jgi:hypothetical protein
MTQLNPKHQATQQNLREPDAASEQPRKGGYLVGKYRPPLHTRWQPGQSGNPKGRPKGRSNVKTELERIVSKKVTVRDGETDHKLTLVGANVLAHGVKGAKGDVRSAGLFLSNAHKLGLLNEEDGTPTENAMGGDQHANAVLIGRANKSRPSDTLFEYLDLSLLSREEQIELSRLAEVIDLGGDITALSAADFERVKHIVNKGQGKDITPQ